MLKLEASSFKADMFCTETPISSYLPQFCPIGDNTIVERATVIDILGHASALEDCASLYFGPNGVPLFRDENTMFKVINSMSVSPGEFRTVWRYNALLYGMVSCLVQKLSGMSYSEFVTTRILFPMGLDSTSFIGKQVSSADIDDRFALPYSGLSDKRVVEVERHETGHQFPFDASEGICSTVVDLVKYGLSIINAYNFHSDLPQFPAVQDVSPCREMETILFPRFLLPPNIGGKSWYCLGWFLTKGNFIFDDVFDIEDDSRYLDWGVAFPGNAPDSVPQTILYHSGCTAGYVSSVHLFPERGDAVAILGNSSFSGDAVDYVSRVITAIICGQEQPPRLEYALQEEADGETARWNHIRADLDDLQKEREVFEILHADQLLGRYVNEERSLVILLLKQEGTASRSQSELGPALGFSAKFGTQTPFALDLWGFCKNILCFFPDELQYQQRGMSYLAHGSQFLLHLNFEDSSAESNGLWWQYHYTKDAIWFARDR